MSELESYAIRAEFWDCFFGDRSAEIACWAQLAARYGRKVLIPMAATGEVAVALADRGFDVLAFDLTPEMVSLGRERARGFPSITFIQADVTSLALADHDFDLVFFGTGDFHHFTQTADQLAAIESAHRHTRSGGGLALDLSNPPERSRFESKISKVHKPFRAPKDPNIRLWKESETHFNPHTWQKNITQTLAVQRSDEISKFTYCISLQLFSKADIYRLLVTTEYKLVAEYGSYQLDEWDASAPRWIVLAEKEH